MIALAFRKPFAFLKKDILTESSYKLSFVSQFFGIFISILTFFFFGKLVGGSSVSAYLKPYGGDYFSFVLIGIAFSDLMFMALGIFEGRVREGQVSGTLEPLLLTQTSFPTILLSSSLYSFLLSFVRAALYLIVGSFFGANFDVSRIFLIILILVISLVNFSAIGLMSASFVLVLKRGNPVGWIFGSLTELIGGVLYPVTILPPFLQFAAKFLPITYSLRAMRGVLIQGQSFFDILTDLSILSLMAVILLAAALFSFKVALKKVKVDGTLTHF